MRRSDRLDSLRYFVEHAFEEPEAEFYLDVHETFGNELLFVEPDAVPDGGKENSIAEPEAWIRARPTDTVDLEEVA